MVAKKHRMVLTVASASQTAQNVKKVSDGFIENGIKAKTYNTGL
jgi:hypothetical protein